MATERAEIAINGMTCASCVSRIERALDKLEGLKQSRVDLTSHSAVVIFDSESLDREQVHEAIRSMGYKTADPPRVSAPETMGGKPSIDLRSFRIPVVILAAATTMLISSVSALRFEGWMWLVGAIATPVVLVGGWEFHRLGWAALVRGRSTMDSLISLGTLTAWGWSAAVTVGRFDTHLYFDTAAVIVAVLLLGRGLEGRARNRAGEAIAALTELEADSVRLEDGSDISPDHLQVGMRFLVRPGERIAADGIVVSGHSTVDTSAMTGEPVPREAGRGSDVIGGTLNVDGSLVVEARKVGSETALAEVRRLTDEALSRKAPIQRVADRVASVFVPVVLAVAAVTLAVSLSLRDPGEAVSSTVAVLIAACPCALGLAIPAAFVAGSGRGARMGVIIRGPDALESARRIDVVAVDKTGTVTEGRLKVVAAEGVGGISPKEVLATAAALESLSEHPIGQAIVAEAGSRGEDAFKRQRYVVNHFRNLPGSGVCGNLLERSGNGKDLDVGCEAAVGKPELFDVVPAPLADAASAHARKGRTVVLAGRRGAAEGLIALHDGVRPGSAQAVDAFKKMGMSVLMLSGDGEAAARRVCEQVGIDEVSAGLTPEGKAEEVIRLQSEGRRVAMIGDGINDAPALATADLGVAVGSGADVALAASDLTLVGDDLRRAADAIAIARSTLATIKGNLFWAFAYNTAIIPLAAVGLLRPEIAAAAMALSSLFVLGNSLRLTRFAPRMESFSVDESQNVASNP